MVWGSVCRTCISWTSHQTTLLGFALLHQFHCHVDEINPRDHLHKITSSRHHVRHTAMALNQKSWNSRFLLMSRAGTCAFRLRTSLPSDTDLQVGVITRVIPRILEQPLSCPSSRFTGFRSNWTFVPGVGLGRAGSYARAKRHLRKMGDSGPQNCGVSGLE